ncbi:MAG: hypothetical protein KKD07_08330, partial [Candidatus Omnitrophica bacterium]|nr:hypothetical protein [Candidatus Omnitrophota bacterium]
MIKMKFSSDCLSLPIRKASIKQASMQNTASEMKPSKLPASSNGISRLGFIPETSILAASCEVSSEMKNLKIDYINYYY